MKRIDLKDFKEALVKLKRGNVLILTSGKEERFALLPIADFEMLQEAFVEASIANPLRFGLPEDIKILTKDNHTLSKSEYEEIKRHLLEALDKNFKSDDYN